ncbi:MAG: carboxymuconolactone decarboxylase family protein [Thermotogota bacterium]|nr:carboxymuconolactone decarboxylase family protein [Thermotogota bacterium]
MNAKSDFMKERDEQNEYVMKYAGKELKRFFSLDSQMYREGVLDKGQKELLGLVASTVLRCDDCIKYHITRCVEENISSEMIQEALSIAAMVGGSIVIPHMRRAFCFLDKITEEEIKLNNHLFLNCLDRIQKIVNAQGEKDEKLQRICQLLKDEIEYYDWVGFYLVDPKKDRELILGPFVGTPTDHKRIKFGDGICGQAAEKEISFVVQDVNLETNYLSCSPEVKSEILSPIFKGGKVVGEIDLDSHTVNPFTEEDRFFLEEVANLCSILF